MRTAAKIIGLLALAAILVAPLLFAFKLLGDAPMKAILLAATVAWFATAPLWLKGGDN